MPFSLERFDTETIAKYIQTRLDMLSAFIDTSMVSWKVPGLAVAIVKDDEFSAEGRRLVADESLPH